MPFALYAIARVRWLWATPYAGVGRIHLGLLLGDFLLGDGLSSGALSPGLDSQVIAFLMLQFCRQINNPLQPKILTLHLLIVYSII